MIEKMNHHYALTNPASVYDEESMTALELAGRTTAKVNECVEAFNEHEKKTDDHLDKQDKDIENAIEKIIPATVSEDVNKHIEDGDFDKQIDEYAGELKARLDNLIASTPEGSTTMDAEVIDTRVDFRGVTHLNAGEAVRAQVSELHTKRDEIATVVKQLYDRNTVTNGYVGSNGQFVETNTYRCSDYIPVELGKSYSFRREQEKFGTNGIPLYDTEKAFLGRADVILFDDYHGKIKITDPNVKYVRYDFRNDDLPFAQFFEGETFHESVYEYGVHKFLANDMHVYAERVTNPIQVEDVAFINRSVNILNPQTVTEGYYIISPSGTLTEGSNYGASDFIKVDAGDKICVTANTNISAGTLGAFYDGNKNLLECIHGTTSEDGKYHVFTVPPLCCYIRVNTYLSDNYMLTKDTYPEAFIPYSVKLDDTIEFSDAQKQYIDENTAGVGSPLVGKSLTVNGDSICAGAGYAGGYAKIIGVRYGMTVQNVGVGGGTITAEQYSSDENPRHWISRTIETMDNTADYAIIEGGVNDASIGVPMGEITSDFNSTLDDTTFCGAFESMLKQLTIRFAGKKIGYIFVHKMTNGFRSDESDDGTSYYWMARKCCEKWGVPFLDLNVSVPPFAFFRWTNITELENMVTTYTANGDGWHPNEEGYLKYYVPKIVAWMESL